MGKWSRKGNLFLGDETVCILKELECPTGRKANYDLFKRVQTLDLDLRMDLSTRKTQRDHKYEVTIF